MTSTEANGVSPADTAAVGAAEAHANPERIDEITLENGIVLTIRPVPPMVIGDAARRVKQPEVPVVLIQSKGVQEANPNDPAYQEAMARFVIEREEAGLNVALLMGIEIKHIPDGMYRPEDDGWIEILETAFGADDFGELTIRREPPAARKLDWLRYYAFPSEDDIVRVSMLVTASTAVSEEEVRQAVDAFRSRAQRLRDIGNTVRSGPQDGDHVPAAVAGDDQRMGGEGSRSLQPDPVD